MVTANVSPERQTSPQNGKRPPRAARNGKRSRVTANVPESQISSNQLKWSVSLTIVTEPALTCNDLPTGPCAPQNCCTDQFLQIETRSNFQTNPEENSRRAQSWRLIELSFARPLGIAHLKPGGQCQRKRKGQFD